MFLPANFFFSANSVKHVTKFYYSYKINKIKMKYLILNYVDYSTDQNYKPNKTIYYLNRQKQV